MLRANCNSTEQLGGPIGRIYRHNRNWFQYEYQTHSNIPAHQVNFHLSCIIYDVTQINELACDIV